MSALLDGNGSAPIAGMCAFVIWFRQLAWYILNMSTWKAYDFIISYNINIYEYEDVLYFNWLI